jgi:hypothetical protein
MSRNPKYNVTTWDCDREAFTRQRGLSGPSLGVSLRQVRRVLRELRERFGYSCHRTRNESDSAVLVERVNRGTT